MAAFRAKTDAAGGTMLQVRGERCVLQGGTRRSDGSATSFRRIILASAAVFALTAFSAFDAAAETGGMDSPAGDSSTVAELEASLMPPPPPSIVVPPSAPAARSENGPWSRTAPGKQQADVGAPLPPKDFSRWGKKDWWVEKRDLLGDAPDMVRYLANECILAGIAGGAIAVAFAMTAPVAVGPVTAVALGATTDMSPLAVTALGCFAGVSAGVASAVAIYAYEEPEVIRDFAVEQAGNVQSAAVAVAQGVQYAAVAAAETVAGVVGQPAETMYAAAAGAWSVAAAAASGVGNAVYAAAGATQAASGAVVAAAASGVGSWWGGPAPVADQEIIAFDVASVPGPTVGVSDAGVY